VDYKAGIAEAIESLKELYFDQESIDGLELCKQEAFAETNSFALFMRWQLLRELLAKESDKMDIDLSFRMKDQKGEIKTFKNSEEFLSWEKTR
jgi:hypothetical protein